MNCLIGINEARNEKIAVPEYAQGTIPFIHNLSVYPRILSQDTHRTLSFLSQDTPRILPVYYTAETMPYLMEG